jgi:excisionase family DNA binding protein
MFDKSFDQLFAQQRLTTGEAALLLGVTARRVQQFVHRGELRYWRKASGRFEYAPFDVVALRKKLDARGPYHVGRPSARDRLAKMGQAALTLTGGSHAAHTQ